MTSAALSHNGKEEGPAYLLHNLMLFAEVLRKLGLDIGSGNVLDLVRATEHAPVGRKQDFYQAARCLLVHRKQDLPVFDEAFQVFWRRPASANPPETYGLWGRIGVSANPRSDLRGERTPMIPVKEETIQLESKLI